MKISLRPTLKQDEAYRKIFDDHTTELLFGGAAGPGKSWLLCEWETVQCVRYPGVRYLLGREELKQLKATTLITLFKVFKHHGLKVGTHCVYNAQSGVVKFWNCSE